MIPARRDTIVTLRYIRAHKRNAVIRIRRANNHGDIGPGMKTNTNTLNSGF
jgi:hypothetical protein